MDIFLLIRRFYGIGMLAYYLDGTYESILFWYVIPNIKVKLGPFSTSQCGGVRARRWFYCDNTEHGWVGK